MSATNETEVNATAHVIGNDSQSLNLNTNSNMGDTATNPILTDELVLNTLAIGAQLLSGEITLSELDRLIGIRTYREQLELFNKAGILSVPEYITRMQSVGWPINVDTIPKASVDSIRYVDEKGTRFVYQKRTSLEDKSKYTHTIDGTPVTKVQYTEHYLNLLSGKDGVSDISTILNNLDPADVIEYETFCNINLRGIELYIEKQKIELWWKITRTNFVSNTSLTDDTVDIYKPNKKFSRRQFLTNAGLGIGGACVASYIAVSLAEFYAKTQYVKGREFASASRLLYRVAPSGYNVEVPMWADDRGKVSGLISHSEIPLRIEGFSGQTHFIRVKAGEGGVISLDELVGYNNLFFGDSIAYGLGAANSLVEEVPSALNLAYTGYGTGQSIELAQAFANQQIFTSNKAKQSRDNKPLSFNLCFYDGNDLLENSVYDGGWHNPLLYSSLGVKPLDEAPSLSLDILKDPAAYALELANWYTSGMVLRRWLRPFMKISDETLYKAAFKVHDPAAFNLMIRNTEIMLCEFVEVSRKAGADVVRIFNFPSRVQLALNKTPSEIIKMGKRVEEKYKGYVQYINLWTYLKRTLNKNDYLKFPNGSYDNHFNESGNKKVGQIVRELINPQDSYGAGKEVL